MYVQRTHAGLGDFSSGELLLLLLLVCHFLPFHKQARLPSICVGVGCMCVLSFVIYLYIEALTEQRAVPGGFPPSLCCKNNFRSLYTFSMQLSRTTRSSSANCKLHTTQNRSASTELLYMCSCLFSNFVLLLINYSVHPAPHRIPTRI